MTLTEAALRIESSSEEMFTQVGSADTQSRSGAVEIAKKILVDVMQYRRMSNPATACEAPFCERCLEPHLGKIVSAVSEGRPVTFVLPAFPGKSPNSAKVLGPLPDMAERCALEFLQHLCDRIRRYYAPGAHMVLCSDGRVFSDVVGLRDEDVTNYQDEISNMIENLGLSSLSTFNLEELYEGLNFDEMRTSLMEHHGEPVEMLQAAVSRGKAEDASVDDKEAHRLYCGITRFLVEDSMFPGQTRSRSSIQKECRVRAYSVVQRSKAWGELVEEQFPDAVRLSIHPQTCGSKKLGIRLIGFETWQTPWHAAAVHVGDRYMLLKRSQAEALGAHLVMRFGRPSHFVLTNPEVIASLQKVENEA